MFAESAMPGVSGIDTYSKRDYMIAHDSATQIRTQAEARGFLTGHRRAGAPGSDWRRTSI